MIEQYQVQTVYHAAAYKHVPLVECNPLAGLKNNSIGTAFSLNAAVKKGVETFVLISTDKAIRPTNVMGASKRMAELYCQAMAEAQNRLRSVLYVLVMFWVHQAPLFHCLSNKLPKRWSHYGDPS